jgi:FtsP/CotA-like multicopper oxidase with cupredoxin domain
VFVFGLALTLSVGFAGFAAADPVPGGSLDPTAIPKYQAPLIVPPAMPTVSSNYYEISMQQFTQQILPPGMPPTTVWSYGALGHPETLNFPAFTIEAQYNQPTIVKWINGLVDSNGNYLPHLLTVDQTLHWANPNKTGASHTTDSHGDDPNPYTGPVPIVTHVHGAHVGPESDGNPEAWWLPDAKNIPAGYGTRGSQWGQIAGEKVEAGAATFRYPNDQPASTLWYHDHALGMTRLNVYAGPAGFYNIRGGPNDLPEGVLPGPAPQLGDAPGTKYHEIPIAIQDRSFNQDGSLFYPDNRAFFEGLAKAQLQIPFAPDAAPGGPSDVAPIWNPETFGNTMVVNGRTWPYLEIEPRRYRFRLLDGTDARYVILKFAKPLSFWQIGAEGGFLPQPVERTELLMSPAERADVIVDFSKFQPGDTITLLNIGPDEPYNGSADFSPADPGTTGQVMQFRVVPLTGPDTSADPATLTLPSPAPLGSASKTRKLSLNELKSTTVFAKEDEAGDLVPDSAKKEPFGPTAALLGIVDAHGNGVPMMWSDDVTETPSLGATEIWEIHNFTADAHPIHLHLVQFQVVNREVVSEESPKYNASSHNVGQVRPPEPWEMGYKDTVTAYPGEITRIKATFDIAGLYVWHCHIIEHEDNEMMRPFVVENFSSGPTFPDVFPTNEFYDAVLYLTQSGIASGYANGMFGVNDSVLRAQVAKLVVMAFKLHDQPITNAANPTFNDLQYEGDPYPFDFVEEAAAAGIVHGYLDGRFGPYEPLTRIQLVRILVQAAGSKLVEPPAGYSPAFTDVDAGDLVLVAKAKYNGLIDGATATLFDPYGDATRGHMAKILHAVLTMDPALSP